MVTADSLGESGKRGQSEYAQFLRRASLDLTGSPATTAGASPGTSFKQRRHSLTTADDSFATAADRFARDSLDWQSVASDTDTAGQPDIAARQASGSIDEVLMQPIDSSRGRDGSTQIVRQQQTGHWQKPDNNSSDQPSTWQATGDGVKDRLAAEQSEVAQAEHSQHIDSDGLPYDSRHLQLLQQQQAQALLGEEEGETRQQQAGVSQGNQAAQQVKYLLGTCLGLQMSGCFCRSL